MCNFQHRVSEVLKGHGVASYTGIDDLGLYAQTFGQYLDRPFGDEVEHGQTGVLRHRESRHTFRFGVDRSSLYSGDHPGADVGGRG
jgi:hypothetical protein